MQANQNSEMSWLNYQNLQRIVGCLQLKKLINALLKKIILGHFLISLQKEGVWCKRVFKTKYGDDDRVERYKSSSVAKGYSQNNGEDYDEGFVQVVNSTTLRTLLTVAATKDLTVPHFDVKAAFLEGKLEETRNRQKVLFHLK